MIGKIFINYRRGDTTAGYAISLYQLFNVYFEKVFLDVNDINIGEDFNVRILKELKETEVLVVLIGKNWLSISYPNGKRRLDNPKDFVRKEIVYALKKNILIVPIIFDNVEIPKTEDLPTVLNKLVTKNFFRIHHEKFFEDVDKLIQNILRQLATKYPSRPVYKKSLKYKLSSKQMIKKEMIAYEAKKKFQKSKMKHWSGDDRFLTICIFKERIAYIQITGYLDAPSTICLEDAILYTIDNKIYNIIIDCKNLVYTSSAGPGVFMEFIETVREHGGDIKITNLSEGVYTIFDLLGMTVLFEILNSVEEAESKFRDS